MANHLKVAKVLSIEGVTRTRLVAAADCQGIWIDRETVARHLQRSLKTNQAPTGPAAKTNKNQTNSPSYQE